MAAVTHARIALPVIDAVALPSRLESEGFRPPPGGFLALVLEVGREPGGRALRGWDWRGTSRGTDWWPASTVKVFVAAAALEAARRRGFGSPARIAFDGPGEPFEDTLAGLVRAALIPSDNEAFDRLAFVAGHAALRRWLARYGFLDTSLWRGYSGMYRDPGTGRGTLAAAPGLTLCQGDRSLSLRPRLDHAPCDVPDHGNRTTLLDLASCLLRIARHEALPPGQRLGLRQADIDLLRDALAAPRPRGLGLADGLRAAFGRDARILHKPGFACDWFSDVAFVDRPAPGPSWIVGMAGRPGRDCLDDATLRVGRLLADGALGAR